MLFKVFKLNYKIIFLFLFIFFLISTICVYTYVLATATTQGIKVPIIMYHSVLKSRSNTYIVNPSVIENDFKYIKENGYTTITITDLINYVYNDSPLPEKPIIITFDDGHYNNLGYVLPLLEKYDMVFIPIFLFSTFAICLSSISNNCSGLILLQSSKHFSKSP